MNGKVKDLTGRVFTRLTVLYQAEGRTNKGGSRWTCRCECGNTFTTSSECLAGGGTRSCGCLRVELHKLRPPRLRHGHYVNGQPSRTYKSYRGMLIRCYNPDAPNYNNYGGRGIIVCDRWKTSFDNFLADMGERPEGHTLDRKENDGNYELSNCKWSTPQEQQANKRPRKRRATT